MRGCRHDRHPPVPWALQRRRLERASDYWLSTTRPDGRPHVVPLWGVWLDGRLYFSTDPASVKGRNLAGEPRAAVHIDGGHDVLIIEGAAARVDDDTVHARVDDAMAAKTFTRWVWNGGPDPTPADG
ncbi:hypothetical protein E1212_19310 [Jiangella ureilytica]|uniref:Pyridoxamine 5'-phosphate oxidase N-terminal domain-containing protein n=1 Tax=Jiangella ureilytica TaxID=2530374 RepID=A0A4R4RKU4_9ACTN|nr:pyridoxamine 5'-phosphate oxidase family protein [Jiangella ureilytica]TDC49123.1 hypothetical protein E1212_19310 [Jiangella ureilytica]